VILTVTLCKIYLRSVKIWFVDGWNIDLLLTKMSEGLQDIEHELAADQSELCSDVDFSEKQVDTFATFYVFA